MQTTDAGTYRTVLHVGDIAGVATSLVEALRLHTDWCAERVDVPSLGASKRGPLHLLGQPARAARIPGRVQRAAAATGADVVHLHWARFAPFVWPGRRPLVVHAHGSDVRRHGRAAALVNAALRRADLVLVSTPDLLEYVPAGATFLPNPVDVELFEPRTTASARNRPVVALFARLDPVKGGDVLVAVAERLLESVPDIEVVAVRGGRSDDAAERAGVTLLDPLSRSAVADLLRRADVVIGQQRLGALGLSELEAMACARPVVVPLRPGLYEETLPVALADDIDDVVGVTVGLLADRDRADQLGLAARRYVVEHHHPAVVGTRLAELYEGVLR